MAAGGQAAAGLAAKLAQGAVGAALQAFYAHTPKALVHFNVRVLNWWMDAGISMGRIMRLHPVCSRTRLRRAGCGHQARAGLLGLDQRRQEVPGHEQR